MASVTPPRLVHWGLSTATLSGPQEACLSPQPVGSPRRTTWWASEGLCLFRESCLDFASRGWFYVGFNSVRTTGPFLGEAPSQVMKLRPLVQALALAELMTTQAERGSPGREGAHPPGCRALWSRAFQKCSGRGGMSENQVARVPTPYPLHPECLSSPPSYTLGFCIRFANKQKNPAVKNIRVHRMA